MWSPVWAIAWELWSSQRRLWWLILGMISVSGLVLRLSAGALAESEGLRSLSFFPLLLTIILVLAIFNFTERDRRKSFAGFPERLFTLPVRTRLLVTCPMLCGVLSVVALYLVWVKLVYEPAGIRLLVRWPTTLLAAGMVFYQAVIWSFAGFRLARLLVLAFGFSLLVAVGCTPYALAWESDGRLEWLLTATLGVGVLGAYGAALAAVESQRRGGGRGWEWWRTLGRKMATALPRRRRPFASPAKALLWLEWHRAGLVLPFGVLLTLLLIVGPATWLSGRGPDAAARAAFWMAILPIVLAVPIGKGIAKPDFWSLELDLPAFLATRPVTDGQIVAAKMKAAALSTLLAWAVLLVVAPIWLGLAYDLEDLRSFWGSFCSIYSPLARWAIPSLALLAAIILTWNFLISSIWTGMSGNWLLYAGFAGFSTACLLCILVFLALCLDTAGDHSGILLVMLPWLPWTLAVCFILKVWGAAEAFWRVRRSRLVAMGTVGRYVCVWTAGTCCMLVLAWLVSARVVWLQDALCLGGLLIVPVARVSAAPLAVARSRHR
jgi:hypothetical protein